MQAIVHIGYPKAGSSSIQSFLHQNRRALSAQGIHYANYRQEDGSGLGSQWEYTLAGLSTIGETISNPEPRKRYGARTLEEQKTTTREFAKRLKQTPRNHAEPVAVISAEHSLPWLDTPKKITAYDMMLQRIFRDGVSYVVYLREQVDHLTSAYSERVKRGATSFPRQLIGRRLKSLNLHRAVRMWADVVGHDRLDVRLLEPGFLTEGDLLTDFLALLDLDPHHPDFTRPPRANESLKAPGAEALRILNKRLPELRPDGGYNPLRNDLVDAVMEISANDEKFRLTHQQAHRIQTHVAHSNDRLRKEFFPDRHSLFQTSPSTIEYRDFARIRARAVEIMTDVIIKLRLGELAVLDEQQKEHAICHGAVRS